MDTSRGATGYLSKGQGRILSEQERAKENAYIQKWEKEKMEKAKQQAEKEKEGGKKISEGEPHKA